MAKSTIMKIQSIKNLIDLLEKFCPGAEMYRGQTCDWPMLPSIGRYPHTVIGYDNWRGFHNALIRKFFRLGHPHIKDQPQKESERWVLAQHYGLPTRLLDTSTNPLKALFFAVNDIAKDKDDGVFWAFTYGGWREDLDEKYRKYWEIAASPFLPPQLNPRLIAQEAAFVSYPLPEDTSPLVPLEELKQKSGVSPELNKFVIPSTAKRNLRLELEKFGVQFRLLFPDLDGVAKSIKLIELLPEHP